ncbi:MAG: cytoplasmic protein [Clostridiales bacterium]|nr:cytoplasmic protein [Clostridiales bacterium]
MGKILLAGESWVSYTVHTKGFDSFYTSTYGCGAGFIIDALTEGGFDVTYLGSELTAEKFPFSKEDLQKYDVVILSDVGSNTLLLSKETFQDSKVVPNRCDILRDYVEDGGAFLMIGGYLSFTGIDGKARYGMTAVADILPVQMLETDDRIELPQGVSPQIVDGSHPVVEGIEGNWPLLLGYNKVIPKEDAITVATIGEDPLISLGEYGRGRSAVFTSDCSPHWGPKEFVEWKYYGTMWNNLMRWLCKRV